MIKFGINNFSDIDIEKVKRFNIIEVAHLLGLNINGSNQINCINSAHDDENPSLTLYEDDNRAYCHGCSYIADNIKFVQDTNHCSFKQAVNWLMDHEERLFDYSINEKKEEKKESVSLSPKLPFIFQDNLTPEDIEFLMKKRGLTEDSIVRFEIGRRKNRYTIPIYQNGKLVNFKLYDPNNKEAKTVYFKKAGEMYLYGMDEMDRNDDIAFVEGEMDRAIMEQMGYCAVSSTSGAGSFKKDWLDLFYGRMVFILFDLDIAGITASEKIYHILSEVALYVGIVKIPKHYPRGTDVTDLYVKYGWGKKQFDNLLRENSSGISSY